MRARTDTPRRSRGTRRKGRSAAYQPATTHLRRRSCKSVRLPNAPFETAVCPPHEPCSARTSPGITRRTPSEPVGAPPPRGQPRQLRTHPRASPARSRFCPAASGEARTAVATGRLCAAPRAAAPSASAVPRSS
eukprot:6434993-Prymnesium_polylepis.1